MPKGTSGPPDFTADHMYDPLAGIFGISLEELKKKDLHFFRTEAVRCSNGKKRPGSFSSYKLAIDYIMKNHTPPEEANASNKKPDSGAVNEKDAVSAETENAS